VTSANARQQVSARPHGVSGSRVGATSTSGCSVVSCGTGGSRGSAGGAAVESGGTEQAKAKRKTETRKIAGLPWLSRGSGVAVGCASPGGRLALACAP